MEGLFMTFIDWLMVATGLLGAIFFGIGIACWLHPHVDRWLERRRVRRVIRAASWRWK
jgi:hypothetical protein